MTDERETRRKRSSGTFWIAFIVFGTLILIGIFYVMVVKPKGISHSPERPSGTEYPQPAPPQGAPHLLSAENQVVSPRATLGNLLSEVHNRSN